MAKEKVDHTNPFNKGVTYDSFLKAIGKKSVKTALKGKCSPEQIEWIELEIETYQKSKKK